MTDTGKPEFSAEDHSHQTDLAGFMIDYLSRAGDLNGSDPDPGPFTEVRFTFEGDEDDGGCLTTDGHHFYRCEICGAVRDDDR